MGSEGDPKAVQAAISIMPAQAGSDDLAVSCGFRKPESHKFFGLSNLLGIGEVFMELSTPQETWEEPIKGLKVLSASSTRNNPVELLDSWRFSEFLASGRREFDHVLLDARS
jgi:Mrp family chromosome partitioning ATPase